MLGLILRRLPSPVRALVLTVLGGILLWGGIRLWIGPARCSGSVMSDGQLCVNSDGTTSTAAQMLDVQYAHAWYPFVTGLLFLAGAAFTLLRPGRTRG
jgi:hypothetical protein